MHDITVPRLNNNDESCVLKQWLQKSGVKIEPGDIVAVLETSKAAFDLESEFGGLLSQTVEAGSDCAFGSVIGHVFADENELDNFTAKRKQSVNTGDPLTITRDAQRLIDAHSIDDAALRSLGKSVIKTKDVEGLIDSTHREPVNSNANDRDDGANFAPLSRRQLGIANTVSRSHATIPPAFIALRIYCDRALKTLKQVLAQKGMNVGLPELVIKTIAKQVDDFPVFFSSVVNGNRLRHVPDPGVGVTIDVGKGLFVPVVKQASSRTLLDIAELLIDFRVKGMRDKFTAEDLQGGNISVSINMDADIELVVPIVMPDQVCMIAMGPVRRELTLNEKGQVEPRAFFTVGLAYDHRAINGFDACRFATTIKKLCEDPNWVLSSL